MKLTDAVNLCLRMSGQGTVNELADEGGGEENSALAQVTIKRIRRELLTNGYHFNTNTIDLVVDADGKVPLSRTFLYVELPDGISFREDSATKGLFLWDESENEFHDATVKKVNVVFDIENFQSLPELFANWIAWRSASEFWAELNQAASATLERRANRAGALFINRLPPGSIFEGTGWNFIASLAGGGTLPSSRGRIWINVG